MAGYLAETMASLSIPLNQTYDDMGNSIIHCVATWGDNYSHVLEYLIRIGTSGTCATFDLNATNHRGFLAISSFRPSQIIRFFMAISTVKFDGLIIWIQSAELIFDQKVMTNKEELCWLWIINFFLGRTALHEAVLLFRPDCHPQHSVINNIQLLLDYGADVRLPVFLLVLPHTFEIS